jgi:hypothetical protein
LIRCSVDTTNPVANQKSLQHVPTKNVSATAFFCVGNFLQGAAALVNWCVVEHRNNLLDRCKKQWPDVEVRRSVTPINVSKTYVGDIYVNIAAFWWLYAGALSSAPGLVGLPGLPHLRTAATLMWK